VTLNDLEKCGHIRNSPHGMQMRSSDENYLSVRPSVSLSNACIVTKRKKDMFRFLYRTKDNLSWFSEKKNGWWGRPLLP